MSDLLICSNGHQWLPVNGSAACPVCGEADSALPHVELAEEPAAESVLARREAEVLEVQPAGEPRVPGFQLLKELGRSPLGVVTYKARQLLPDRTVFLKVVRAADDPRRIGRDHLLTEIDLMGCVQHPNVAQLYQAGEAPGVFYCAQQYAEGGPLADKVRGPIPPPEAARLVEALARAVHHMHQQGVLHCGLRPAAVYLAADGSPRITDFGLARPSKEKAPNEWDVQSGDVAFLAPEQAGGRAREVGRATDVYGLGALLYTLLGGRPPFHGRGRHDTLDEVLFGDLLPPSRPLRRKLPADIEAVCMRCLRREPRRRYRNAELLAEELRRFQAGLPVEGRARGFWERFGGLLRHHPAAAGLFASVVICFVLLLILLGRESADRDPPQLYRQTYTPKVIPKGQAVVPPQAMREARPPERDRLGDYLLRLARADAELLAGNQAHAQRLLADCPEELRRWEWALLKRRAVGQPEVALERDLDQPVSGVVLAPAGRFVAAALGTWTGDEWRPREIEAREPGRICLLGLVPDQVGQNMPVSVGPATCLALSPNGRWLAAGVWNMATGSPVIQLWNARTGRLYGQLLGHDGLVSCLSFDPTSNMLASGSYDGTIRFWDIPSGRRLAPVLDPVPGGNFPCHALAFSPEGRRLAAVNTNPDDRRDEVRVWSLETDQHAGMLHRPTSAAVHALAFSLEGQRLVMAQGDGTVLLWDLGTNQAQQVLRGHTAKVVALTFQPGGARLATGSHDGTVKLWDVESGLEVFTLRGAGGPVSGLAFEPEDGTRLATVSGKLVKVWDARPPGR